MFVASRLRELREEKDIQQKELSMVLDVKPQTVSYYERGVSFPSASVLEKMAVYFDVSLDYLMGLTDVRASYNRNDVIPLPPGYPSILKSEMQKHLALLTNMYMQKKK